MIYLFTRRAWVVLFLITFLIASCSSIPEKELNDARMAIRESEKVNANKYAADELNDAKRYLKTAEAYVEKDDDKAENNVVEAPEPGFEKDNEKAKVNAIKAKDMGDKAYFKALAEFTKSQNEGTQKNKEEAKASYADKLVPDKYQEADKLYGDVQKDLKKLDILSKRLKVEKQKEEAKEKE